MLLNYTKHLALKKYNNSEKKRLCEKLNLLTSVIVIFLNSYNASINTYICITALRFFKPITLYMSEKRLYCDVSEATFT